MSLARAARAVVYLSIYPLLGCSSEGAPGKAAGGGSPVGSGGSSAVLVGAGGLGGGGAGSGSGGKALGGSPLGGSGGVPPLTQAPNLFDAPLSGQHAAFEEAEHSLLPTSLWGRLQKPFPTNAWWKNLVLGQGKSQVAVYPYMVAATELGLRVSLPRLEVQAAYLFSVFSDDLLLSSVDTLGPRSVVAHDALSVTLAWAQGTSELRTPLVQGMAHVSAHYRGLRPRLTTSHAIVAVSTLPGDRVDLTLNNGQTWRVYSSQALSWQRSEDGLEASAPLDGWLRVAVVGSPELGTLLDASAPSVPVGGEVAARAEGDAALLDFSWKTDGIGEPLLMALPHHLPTLQTPLQQASVETLRGPMRAVLGKRWQFREPLTQLAWSAPRPIAPQRRADIEAALRVDAAALQPTSEEPYFFGKQVAAVARLALIADELGDQALSQQLLEKMKGWLEPWLAGGSRSRLVYDRSWGGLVSRPGIADASADFGLGYYNDHHFQYGYFIYSAAVLARTDRAWADAHRAAIEALLRDYANPAADADFPAFRCKDWFAGHSWAAGIFEFADSRNQESTSEAINGYYAAYLWGLAMQDERLRDLGRLLLATEVRSAQTYWQITDTSIYPEPFASGKIVGVLWATKADRTTWFGNNLEFIHGIQWMPFTPASEELLPSKWISQTYPLVSGAFTRSDPVMGEGWRGLVYMAHAIIDPDAAWSELQTLGSFDDGNSRTNALYWAATR